MRIDFIILKNYRPYLDEKIVFSNDEKHKNFTIIQGANGVGKSSLLNAITWCLYDEEIDLKTDQKGLPIFNTEAFENLKKNQILEVKVEIQMIDKEGLKHNFIRTIKYRKGGDGIEEIVPDVSSNFQYETGFMQTFPSSICELQLLSTLSQISVFPGFIFALLLLQSNWG